MSPRAKEVISDPNNKFSEAKVNLNVAKMKEDEMKNKMKFMKKKIKLCVSITFVLLIGLVMGIVLKMK